MWNRSSKKKRKPTKMDEIDNIREGHPHYGYRMRLFCRTGFHLTIANENIVGINDDSGEFAEYRKSI